MREKLIDLLMDTLPDDCPWEGNIKGLVDHLIANGVTIVTPVTVPELTEEQIEELRERLRNSRPHIITHDVEPQIVVVNKQQWIPVSERLPEPYVDVAVCRCDGVNRTVGVEYIIMRDDLVPAWSKDYLSWKTRVTHWMPMPEPPKEGRV